jgi:hypothetical protein
MKRESKNCGLRVGNRDLGMRIVNGWGLRIWNAELNIEQ